MDDIRLKFGFLRHPKTRLLKRRLGPDAVLSLVELWLFCAQNHRDGVMRGMSPEQIEIAADWDGDHGLFVRTALEVGFLERQNGCLEIHDWQYHQPFVMNFESRSLSAKKSIHDRWLKEKKYHKRTEWCGEECLITIPNEYETCTERIPNVYQTNTERIPNVYQTNTERIPNEYGTNTPGNTNQYDPYTPTPTPAPPPHYSEGTTYVCSSYEPEPPPEEWENDPVPFDDDQDEEFEAAWESRIEKGEE